MENKIKPSKMQSRKLFLCEYWLLVTVIFLIGFVASDTTADKDKCGKILINLLPCNPFVTTGGERNQPTSNCCSALNNVLRQTRECLCILVKDINDPSFAAFKLNATLALGLPDRCYLPSHVDKCPELLHLSPNSADAQVFNDYVNSHKVSNGIAASPQAQGKSGSKSDGFGQVNWLRMEVVCGFILTLMFLMLPNSFIFFFSLNKLLQ